MVTHNKTKQKLTKIDRSKRKKPSAASAHGIDTKGMPAKDAKAVEKAAESLPKPRQPALPAPGMAPPHYAELGGLAEKIFEKREASKLASREVKSAERALIQAMKQRNVPAYVDRGLNIEMRVEGIDKIKVKKFNHAKAKRRK